MSRRRYKYPHNLKPGDVFLFDKQWHMTVAARVPARIPVKVCVDTLTGRLYISPSKALRVRT